MSQHEIIICYACAPFDLFLSIDDEMNPGHEMTWVCFHEMKLNMDSLENLVNTSTNILCYRFPQG